MFKKYSIRIFFILITELFGAPLHFKLEVSISLSSPQSGFALERGILGGLAV